MAGGKETPRQKMIGMMYLVLTALLAMNVSKEIINAFVTLNEKLETGNEILHQKNADKMSVFDQTVVLMKSQEASEEAIAQVQMWGGKAQQIEDWTKSLSNHFIGEAGAMIEEADGVKFTTEDEQGWLHLMPLSQVNKKDDYDIATRLFGGDDVANLAPRGVALMDSIKSFRKRVCESLGTYVENGKHYIFEAPDLVKKNSADTSYMVELEKALEAESVNPKDRDNMRRVYRQLTEIIPEKEQNHDEELPWTMSKFDHSPVVAAAAIFTSLKTDVLQVETMALDHFASKIGAPVYKFNKIEPMAFASSAYMNMGDSILLKVKVAAYDSTEESVLEYWIDDSLMEDANKMTYTDASGRPLALTGGPGEHTVRGLIAVEERGQKKWKPWRFDYKVGAPTSAIGNAEMSVMYVNYDNKITASASGYNEVNVSCQGCSSFSPIGENMYNARVTRPGQQATVSVYGVKEDGTTELVSSQQFNVLGMPKPQVQVAGTRLGDRMIAKQALADGFFQASMPGSPLQIPVRVTGGSVKISFQGMVRTYPLNGPRMGEQVKPLIRNMTPGSLVTIIPSVTQGGHPVQVAPLTYEIR